MRFNPSPEQVALSQAVSAFLDEHADADRAAVLDEKAPFDNDAWLRAAQELGLSSIGLGDEQGGAGGTLVDLAVVMERAGQSMTSLPFWAAAVASQALVQLGGPAEVSGLLARIAEGTSIPAIAGLARHQEIGAVRGGGGWAVSGTAAHVVSGAWLNRFIVIASAQDGVHLFGIDPDHESVTLTPEQSLDPGRQLVTAKFEATAATELSTGPVDGSTLQRLQAEAAVLLAAEQVGVAQGALDMAVEYAKTREQFGRAIGSFQALKHLLADLYVDVATGRDTARYAAWALSTDITADQAATLGHLTRAYVTPKATRVCAGNLQVHGGIGYTWEHPAHLYYKRAITSAHLLGRVDAELDAIADTIGLDD